MAQSRYRILAVDDDADVLEFLGHVFKDDYDVFLASDGDNALEILHNNPIDLLITDQRMPQMPGIELIEEANKLNPAMARILLTGYPEQNTLIDAINRGEVQRYITKPFKINELRLAIRDSLEAYQLRLDKERLLAEQQLRLNALTVFLDLSREAAQAGSYEEIVQAVIKYLPYLVEFDACAALVEQDTSGRSLLHIHCRHAVHEEPLFQIRDGVLGTYHTLTKRRLDEKNLSLQVTGERAEPKGSSVPFKSRLSVLLRPEGEPAGVIELFAVKPEAFSEETRTLLDILANQTSHIITALRKQLLTERQRLELMVQSLADGVLMVDERDRVFVVNPAARQMLHLPPDTPVDTQYLKHTLGFYPFDLVRGWPTREHAIVREQIQVFDRVLHSIVSPVLMDGKLVGVAVVLRDITEEKRIEDRKEEFVSIISHELRSPLTSIGGALDLLQNGLAGPVNEKQMRYVRLAKSSCEKLNVIIDDLIDTRRFEEGKLQMEVDQLNLDQLIQEATENYQAAALEKRVHLEVKAPAQPVSVIGDRNRLHQVLNNLLSNALKFTPEQGVILVELLVTDDLPELVGVSVFNNGEEIDEQDHQRIFDKFEQAQRSRPGMVSGSGLGLSISKNIVEAHGGAIWVESGRGEGTRFIFTVPTLPSPSTQPQTEHEKTPWLTRSKSPPRLLVVNDDPAAAYVLKGFLVGCGYYAHVATNRNEALRCARDRHPDLILMDLGKSQTDFRQLSDILRHDPETREIPMLLLLVLSSENEAFRSGAAAYLNKPVALEDLLEKVQGLLEARRLIRRMYQVLIVDDDPAIRAVCCEVLKQHGYAVFEAGSGRHALELLAKQQFDAILLDIMLPDFDGFQMTEKIRADRSSAAVPIIFVSSLGKTSDKIHALRSGGDDYVVKPFDALELAARVDSVIQRKEREQGTSPNTGLPGSTLLERELNRRLASLKPFVLCYLDIDQLKPFNDYYGYAKADGVVQQTADLIRDVVFKLGSAADFVGHIAGDDFVIVCEPDHLQPIAEQIIQTFDRLIPLYYNESDRQRGYIEADDRFGQRRRFPVMSISLAAIHAQPGQYHSPVELSIRAAELKKKAKAIPGSILVDSTERHE